MVTGVLDLSFELIAQFRPFAIVAPGFAQLDEAAATPLTSLQRSGSGPVAPYAAVEAAVVSAHRGVALGLASGDGEHVLATYDPRRRAVAIEVRVDGGTTTVARRFVPMMIAPSRLAFVLCENQVTLLAGRRGRPWRPLLTERAAVSELVDLRDPETLARFTYAWGPSRAGSAPGLGRVRAGPFGYTGLRDLHLVQDTDGRPYVHDGKVWVTATCAGMGFFHAAHWGVFTLDLDDPTELEQVGQLYFRRDGLLVGDHAGQVVVDEAAGSAIVGVSSWGAFTPATGVHVRHVSTSLDVLTGVHVLETERLDLPTRMSAWDPAMTRIDDRWHVGFVESPAQGDPFEFRPALAVGEPGGDWGERLTLVAADTSLEQTEGPILQQVGGQWWLLASDGRHREYLVYDLQLQRHGTLDAPYGSNIPHPQLVPLPAGGWWLLTFEGTQYAEQRLGYGGHGDVVVMRAD